MPLVAAQVQLQALGDGAGHEPAAWIQSRAEDALAALQMMSTMLKDLFDIGRSEAGHLDLRRQTLNLKDVVASLPSVRADARDGNLVNVDIGNTQVVEADRYHLERILGNFVDNALKYAEFGTPVIVQACERGSEVVISVVDQGIGIAPEDLPHVFERGFRGGAARQWADGAGLGLYNVRLLVEAHGGRVWAESEPGRGSRFHIALPRSVQ